VRQLHLRDLREGDGRVYLPDALERKYPNATAEWPWQWVFPASRRSIDPRSGIERRHHQDESGLQKAIRQAARDANIRKQAHRPAYLTTQLCHRLLASGYDIRTIQKLLGHNSGETTTVYTPFSTAAPASAARWKRSTGYSGMTYLARRPRVERRSSLKRLERKRFLE
jgi:integrase